MKSIPVDLTKMLSLGGSWHNIPGKDAASFITAALQAMSEPGKTDRVQLAAAIISRETTSSTALGDGLAFPHPLSEGFTFVGEPFVAVAYPRFPVLWDATSGVLVKTIFFVVCANRNQHLLTLSELAKQCSRREVKAALRDEAPVKELIELMAAVPG
jgi:nitrogen PTS system EIIA component